MAVTYAFKWFEDVKKVWQEMLGLKDYFGCAEHHRSGVNHFHTIMTLCGSGDSRTVVEESYSRDWLSVGCVWAWFMSEGTVASFVRTKVLSRKLTTEEEDAMKALRSCYQGLDHDTVQLQFVLWLRSDLKCLPGEDEDEFVRLLFLAVYVDTHTAHLTELGGVSIDYLQRRSLPTTWSKADIMKSDADFFVDFAEFEKDPVLVAAQRRAWREGGCVSSEGGCVSSVRLQYLQGMSVFDGPRERIRPGGPYRGLDLEKSVTTRLVTELHFVYQEWAGSTEDETFNELADIRAWSDNYHYLMVFGDSRVDAWSCLRDSQGELISSEANIPTWASFMELEQTEGHAPQNDGRWPMADGDEDGIRLSTCAQRKRFIEKYGAELFWSLLQPKTQHHRCSREYCCKETTEVVRNSDGTKSFRKVAEKCRFGFDACRGLKL